MKPGLSAIIITRNEAKNIAACLESVAFCDQRIVVDSGSTDETVAIAKGCGAEVTTHEWAGFGVQKNFALSLARGDWVLSIDADERVSPPLAGEILATVASGTADGYEMPRLSTFLGRPMRHSGWFPDYVLRLFRRDVAGSPTISSMSGSSAEAASRVWSPLDHHPVLRLEDAVARADGYSTAGAKMLAASGRRVTFMSGITHGIWSFLRAYILRRGFLDGHEGFLLAVANAEGTYYRYMKAWLARRQLG
jgi:glycosyltransferase involved in cell wall biosynthesis